MMWKTSRRGFAALGAASVLLTSCSGSDGDNGSAGQQDAITVTLAAGAWTNTVQERVSEFTEESGIEVNLDVLGLDQLNNQYQVKLNAESTDFDVMAYLPLQSAQMFASNGWAEDLSERVQEDTEWDWEDFSPAARSATEVEGGIYGVPLMTEREIMFYNKDMFADAGVEVPTTLDELMVAAEELHDPTNGQFGVVLRGQANSAVTTFSGFLYSFGGDWMDEAGNPTVNTPEAIAAYDYYGELLSQYGPPGAGNLGATEARAVFQQGQAAIYIDPDSGAGLLEDESESLIAGSVGYAPFPAGPAGSHPYDVTSWAAGINKFSENKDAAWEFIKWATSEEILGAAMSEQGSPSPRSTSWADPSVTEGYPSELVEIVKLYEGETVGTWYPLVEQVGKVRDIVGSPITAAINGEDVKDSADKANADFAELLESESN